MSIVCSVLLEGKQRFKSGGVMCVNIIIVYVCFNAHSLALYVYILCMITSFIMYSSYILFCSDICVGAGSI